MLSATCPKTSAPKNAPATAATATSPLVAAFMWKSCAMSGSATPMMKKSKPSSSTPMADRIQTFRWVLVNGVSSRCCSKDFNAEMTVLMGLRPGDNG